MAIPHHATATFESLNAIILIHCAP